ncbi:MAG: hypothetical protein PHV23_03810 [Candidatus Gracilibacteria bacterium]|nr:hypothetical protein [Candidatus Gracilibacteria bacterium]
MVNKNDIQSFNDDNYGRNKEYFKNQPGMMKEMVQYAKDNLTRIKKDEAESRWIDSDFKSELEKFLAEYEKIESDTTKGVKKVSDDLDVEKNKSAGKKEKKNSEIENYNFSTISNLSDNLKTLDGLEANNTLIVNIKDSNSKLRLRDDNQRIIDRIKQGTEVIYTGTHKEIEGNTFVEVKVGDKKGYVALGYLKNKEVAIVPDNTETLEIKTGEKVKDSTESKQKIPVVKVPVTESEGEYLSGVDIPADKLDKSIFTQTYLFEKGNTYLIGKDGEKILQTNELTKENKELLKKYEKVSILSEILDIWKDKATKVANGLMWKDSRNDDEIILEQINKIQDKFSYIFQDVQNGKNISVEDINEIWNYITIAENEESIIGGSDMEKVKGFLMDDTDTKDQKLIKIYNQMRYGGLSGNSERVKEKVVNHLLNSPEFKKENDILKNPKLLDYISNNNKTELEKLIGKEMTNTILETYSKIKSKQEKHRDEYAKQLESINEERKKSGEKEIKLDDFIKLNVDLSIQNILTHTLLEEKIAKEDKRGSEDESYKGIYANLTGLGKDKGFFSDKVFTISDDNIDTAIDVSSTVALSIVSMGVGALAARGALAAATWGARVTTLAEGVNGLGRTGGLAKFGATASIEGVAFYEGTTITNNLIYGNTAWNSETGNAKEIFKSIAFMGVLRGASKVMEEAKLANAIKKDSIEIGQMGAKGVDLGKTGNALAAIGNLSEKVPALMFKNTSITAVLAEAGLLTSTSVGLEYAFEGEADWTWEEYLQAIVMVGALKMAGKVTLRKNKEGKVEVKVENDTSKGNKKESKSERLKKYNEKIESIEKKLKLIPEFFGSVIDKKLSSLPFYLDKAYTFPKWFIHNGNNFRYIPREIGNSLITPKILIKDLPKNLSEGQYKQAIKNVLFSSNDITWKGGIMKIGAYFTIPFTIEEIYKFNTVEGYEWGAGTMSDAAIAIAQDGISNMYLGVINSMIIEYFNNNTILEQ